MSPLRRSGRIRRLEVMAVCAFAFGASRAAAAPPAPSAAPAVLAPPSRTTIALAPFETIVSIKADVSLGDDAYEAGEYEKAREHYDRALRVAPKSSAARTGILRSRMALLAPSLVYAAAKGNREVAGLVKELERCSRSAPSFAPASFELGRAYLLLGDAVSAVPPLRTSVQLLPLEPEAHSALGVALIASGHADLGVAPLAKAAAIDPSNGARHGNLGTALMMLGRAKDAISEYESAVKLAPEDPSAHSDLGTALLSNHETARATEQLRRAVSLEPTRATFHSNLGYALQQGGHLADAIIEYRRALELDDSLASAWINLGTALSRSPSTTPEARAAFLRAKKIDPTDPRVKANLEELDALEGARSKVSP